MRKMPLNQIAFGKTDAFNELNTFGQEYFMESFVANPKYHIDDFLSGSRFFVCGKKGTGKSALLKYLECHFLKDESNLVFPIRFKSEIEQVDKDSFEEIASAPDNSTKNEKYDTSSILDQSSYVLVWKTFLINQIITRASAGEYRVFNETSTDYKLIVSLLKCIYGESKTSSVVMPKIKKGSIELTAAFAENLSASLKLELEFDSQKKRINYTKLSKKVYQIFSQLEFVHSPVYVLIDELELSVRNKYQFEKDVALVRDLIIAIDDMNTLCSNKGMQIHTIAAIRSEVLRNVRSTGYELTKPIEDRGIEINWFQKGGDYKENQLLTIIENKIHASEQMSGFPPSKDVWKEYFGEDINGEETRKYILNNSLYRPRDIIRMMSAIHNQIGTSEKFTQEAFELRPQHLAEQSVDHTVAVVRFRRGFRNEILPAALTPCDTLFLLAEIKLQFQQVQLKDIFNRIPQPVSERHRPARKALVHQRGVCLLQRSIPFPLRGALIIGKTDLQQIPNTQLRPAWLVQRLKNCGTFLGRENGRTSVLHCHCVPKMFRGIKSGYGIDPLDPIRQVADLFFKILIVRIRNLHAFQKQRVLRPEPLDHSMVFRKIQRSKPNKFLRWRSAPEFFYMPILANQ